MFHCTEFFAVFQGILYFIEVYPAVTWASHHSLNIPHILPAEIFSFFPLLPLPILTQF